MKKQSSIDWIEGYLKKFNYVEDSLALRKAFEEAKKIHKQEIIEARDDGFDSTYAEYGETPKCYLDGSSEGYYKNTYEREN